MDVCFNIFRARRYHNPISSILLLSDGKDEDAHIRVKALLDKYNIERSFTVNTFGLGKDHDAVLMDDIAQLKDGSFSYIAETKTVAESFTHCVGGLVSIVAKNGVINITPNNPLFG